jgi:hypothetical protein
MQVFLKVRKRKGLEVSCARGDDSPQELSLGYQVMLSPVPNLIAG